MNNDSISRQRILDELDKIINIGVKSEDGRHYIPAEIFRDFVAVQPSDQPERKTGRWIYTNTIGGMRYYGCAICANQEKDCIADEHEIQWYNYCPNCGAKMESEVK